MERGAEKCISGPRLSTSDNLTVHCFIRNIKKTCCIINFRIIFHNLKVSLKPSIVYFSDYCSGTIVEKKNCHMIIYQHEIPSTYSKWISCFRICEWVTLKIRHSEALCQYFLGRRKPVYNKNYSKASRNVNLNFYFLTDCQTRKT